jgi:plastocyanin
LRRKGLVAVAAVAASGVLAGVLAQGAPARPTKATLHLSASKSALKFNVTKLSAKHGSVTLVMANPSTFKHGIAIEGKGVDKDGKTVGKGKTSTVTVTLKKGKYTFYCPVPGHRAAGMKGTLTVS